MYTTYAIHYCIRILCCEVLHHAVYNYIRQHLLSLCGEKQEHNVIEHKHFSFGSKQIQCFCIQVACS
jgi:hypothetical protein